MYDEHAWFIFNGKKYGPRTIVKFKKEFCDSRTMDKNNSTEWTRCWPYGKLSGRREYYNGVGFVEFIAVNWYGTYHTCARFPSFRIPLDEFEDAIEEIVDPHEIIEQPPKKDYEVEGFWMMWLIYIGVMIASTIFNGFWGLWIIETFVFFAFRAKVLGGSN